MREISKIDLRGNVFTQGNMLPGELTEMGKLRQLRDICTAIWITNVWRDMNQVGLAWLGNLVGFEMLGQWAGACSA